MFRTCFALREPSSTVSIDTDALFLSGPTKFFFSSSQLSSWGDRLPLVEMYFGSGTLTDEQKADLSRKVTDLIVKEAKQPQHYTWVIIHEVPEANWMVDRLTLPELKAKQRAEKR
jgi:4-oxalocrotonate tautomerase family enzyme